MLTLQNSAITNLPQDSESVNSLFSGEMFTFFVYLGVISAFIRSAIPL